MNTNLPMSRQQNAVAFALFLSITAPTDEKAAKAAQMAQECAAGLSGEEVEACKAAALAEIESGGAGQKFSASLGH